MNIHFIGIGGIGVSALAKYYLKKGWRVSGSDLAASEITDQLKDMGVKVSIGKPKASLVAKGVARVIFSPAVKESHAERVAAKKQRIPCLSYPQALGELTEEHFTIAISGTHGKSTTTAMLGILLSKAGLDPTVIVGTKIKEFNDSNCRVGKSAYLVIEADEYAASFLNYRPHIAILTTLEADHLDYYKTFANIKAAFKKYVQSLPKDGIVIVNRDEKNLVSLLKGFRGNIVWYSLKQQEASALARTLGVPGKHNVSNALGALAAARVLHVSDKKSFKALSEFKGSWRRFEIFHMRKPKPYVLVSDYGHHPTEIKATVGAAREKWPKKNIWLAYQPHQYQRTFYLFKDFVRVLSRLPIQKLLLLNIYDVAGREEGNIQKKVSSAGLAEAIRKAKPGFEVLHIPEAKEAEAYLAGNLKGGEAVMVMGAGDIYQNLTVRLTRSLQRRKI
ncbi:MAG: Mur ligase domain-containing protein [bacterium]|nr:Mur ligase domain-containing protein [bacterium]